MNAEQLQQYAEENWMIESIDDSNFLVTVTWADDTEVVGLLSFAAEGIVVIGCPVDDDVLAESASIRELLELGTFLVMPSLDGRGNILATAAEIENLDFESFDEMYDEVFDAVDGATPRD